MDQYGLLLESQGMGVAVDDPVTLFSENDGARIFLPYRFLRETDPFPHSWSVTSDSIAAYLAVCFQIDQLVLLKTVDAALPSPSPVERVVESGIVDGQFGHYLSPETQCWIANGNAPQLLLDLQRYGTQVIPGGE
jgi:aspartokinase-like uncharacterized kinase